MTVGLNTSFQGNCNTAQANKKKGISTGGKIAIGAYTGASAIYGGMMGDLLAKSGVETIDRVFDISNTLKTGDLAGIADTFNSRSIGFLDKTAEQNVKIDKSIKETLSKTLFGDKDINKVVEKMSTASSEENANLLKDALKKFENLPKTGKIIGTVAAGAVALGIGLGIAAIVKHCKNSKAEKAAQ